MPPIPKTEPWWPKNRALVFFLVGCLVLVNGGKYLLDRSREYARQQRFIPYLAPADSLRRRLGLLPISPDFELSFYSSEKMSSGYSFDDAFYHVKKTVGYPGRPTKTLTVSPDTGEWLAEEEAFGFVSPDTVDTGSGSEHLAITLTREYSFARARANRPPWQICVTTSSVKLKPGMSLKDPANDAIYAKQTDTTFTYLQADSLLRAWRKRSSSPRARQ